MTSDTTSPDVVTAQDTDITEQITAVLAQYQALWDTQEYARLAELWDTEDPLPIYVPEEWTAGAITGWDAVTRYWDPIPGTVVLQAIRNVYSNVTAKLVADDVAVAVFDLRYDMKIVGQPPTGGNDRVMAVFKRREGQWRFSAYIEAPLNPVALVRRLYQESVPADFQDYLATKGKEAPEGAALPWGG